MCVTVSEQRLETTLKLKVDIHNWNKDAEKVIGKTVRRRS